MDRAFNFTNEQMKVGNHYSAVVIQASLVEEALREARFMKILSGADFNNPEGLEESNNAAVKVYDDDFYTSIREGETERAITKELARSLHKYRKKRNAMIHYAFESGIKRKEAQVFIIQGNRLLRNLGNRITSFTSQYYK